jgi:hypothetical protein
MIKILLFIIITILIVSLFLYSKLLPYKNKLTDKYQNIFYFFESIFSPLLNFLSKIAKPVQVGKGIAIDMSSIILLFLFLFILGLLV